MTDKEIQMKLKESWDIAKLTWQDKLSTEYEINCVQVLGALIDDISKINSTIETGTEQFNIRVGILERKL